jgi:hypothetical protein
VIDRVGLENSYPGMNFTMDASGNVYYLKSSGNSGIGDIWKGDGVTAPQAVYTSGGINPVITVGAEQLSVQATGQVAFYGSTTTMEGTWLLPDNSSAVPTLLYAYPDGGGQQYWIGSINSNAALPVMYDYNISYFAAGINIVSAPSYAPQSTGMGSVGAPFGFFTPGMNDIGEAVWVYGTGTGLGFDFYSPTGGSVFNDPNVQASFGPGATVAPVARNAAGTTSLGTSFINKNGFSPLIYSQGGEVKLSLLRFDPKPVISVDPSGFPNTFLGVGTQQPSPAKVPALVHGGMAGTGNFGGQLCGNSAINNYNDVIFISGSGAAPSIGTSSACNVTLFVVDPSAAAPRQVITQGDIISSSGANYAITSISATSPQSINDHGQIAVYVGVGNSGFLVRADPMPGSSAENPLMPVTPAPGTFETIKTVYTYEGLFWGYLPGACTGHFCIVTGNNGSCGGSGPQGCPAPEVWLDPPMALGYTFSVGPGAPPFASAFVPRPLPQGQSSFVIEYAGTTATLNAEQPFDFTAVAPQGVTSFTIRGINASEALNATNPASFVTGVSFASIPTTGFPVTIAAITDSGPTITPTVTGTLGTNGWYTSTVAVSWSVADAAGASILTQTGCTPVTIATDTMGQTVTCSATTAAGTATNTVTIERDATAPTAVGTASPPANANGWNNTSVVAHFTGADGTSGIFSCTPDISLSAEGAKQLVSGNCIDKAGNVSVAATVTANIDKTAPTIAIGAPTNGGAYPRGSIANASYTCTDTLSGVASCVGLTASGTPFSTATAGNNSFTVVASDKAGNATTTTANYVVTAILLGDVNGDGVVNCLDLQLIKASFGSKRGQPAYNAAADVNGDGVVNIVDLSTVARALPAGTGCQ